MNPSDELDSILSGRRVTGSTDELLAPLLETNARLAPFAEASPSPSFTDALEARVLAHATHLTNETGFRSELSFDDTGIETRQDYAVAYSAPETRHDSWRDTPSRWRAAAITVAFVVVCLSVFTLVANARMGGPFSQSSSNASAASRARLQMQSASQALTMLDQAVTRQSGNIAYLSALTTLRTDVQAAMTLIDAMPSAADRAGLLTQLRDLEAQARGDLRGALPRLSWSLRAATTLTLGTIGDTVPLISRAQVAQWEDHFWQITLTGANFASGGVLLVNDQPGGTVIALNPMQMVARISAQGFQAPPNYVGIGEPDDTAAEADATLVPAIGATSTPVSGN